MRLPGHSMHTRRDGTRVLLSYRFSLRMEHSILCAWMLGVGRGAKLTGVHDHTYMTMLGWGCSQSLQSFVLTTIIQIMRSTLYTHMISNFVQTTCRKSSTAHSSSSSTRRLTSVAVVSEFSARSSSVDPSATSTIPHTPIANMYPVPSAYL